MVAGTLAGAGYFMGETLWGATSANPKGFFEDREINAINEDLIAQVIPVRPPIFGKWFYRDRPTTLQRWLARVPLDTEIPCPSTLRERIDRQVAHRPFCFKDPRFCYTLPAWRPSVGHAVFLCVFRHPAETAQSILKECARAGYLKSLAMSFERAVEVWTLMYRHVLRQHHEGRWLFLHYRQVLTSEGLDKIGSFVDVEVDRDFPDRALRRSSGSRPVPLESADLYRRLCDIAGFDDSLET